MTGLLLEIKLAVRGLSRRPWAVAAAAISLALGFAVQIVVLSCTNAVLWKPLAVPQPDRVVTIYGHSELIGSLTNISFPQLQRLAALNLFDSIAAFTRFQVVWESDQAAEKIGVEMVSDGYFDCLRPPLEFGAPPKEAGEVLLGYDFWRNRLGAAHDVSGRTLEINGETYRVTGVMGREFRGSLFDYLGNPSVWLSVRSQNMLPFLKGMDLTQDWVINWFVGVARLRPGITAEQAQIAITAFEKENPLPVEATQREARVFSAERANFHPDARFRVAQMLTLSAGLAGLLLVLGCLNAALFLAGKALAESRQAGMERALGAGLTRIARRRFAEAILLCGASLALGTAVAAWSIQLLATFPPPLAMIVFKPVWDWRVWSLTVAWTTLAVFIAGLAPAFVAIRSSAAPLQTAYSGPSRPARRLREALVALQVAVAAAILVVSGCVIRTVVAARAVDVGFDTDGLVMAEVDLFSKTAGADRRFETRGSDAEERREIVRRVLAELRERPEVSDAAAAMLMPLTIFRKPGRVGTAPGNSVPVYSNTVSDHFFETLGLPLEKGRGFDQGPSSANEAVVNQTLARILKPQGDILGSTLDVLNEEGELTKRFTIVGVVRDAKYHTLWQSDIPYFYVMDETVSQAILVRSRGGIRQAWQAIRESALLVNPRALVSPASTADSQTGGLIREQSYLAAFFTVIGIIAVIVAAGGLMANLYLMVSQRTREIGIRQALGASRAAVLRVVVRQGLLVAGGGLLLGLAAGHQLETWIHPLTPGTLEGDPWPLLVTFAVICGVSLLSALGPALRAARIQPWNAIRHTE